MKVNHNGVIRDMTEEEEKMLTPPEVFPEDTMQEKLDKLENLLNRVLPLLEKIGNNS